jgi:hypothetical protein
MLPSAGPADHGDEKTGERHMPGGGSNGNKLIAMIKAEGFSFAPAIMTEAGKEGVPLGLALALVEQESAFRNIFGADHGPQNAVPWCHQPVTQQRVQELIRYVENGGISNGVGLTQLTSIDLIKQAEAEGGAHTPEAQCRVGFRLLHGLIERHGEHTGIGAYDGGEGNPPTKQTEQYADDVIALRAKWHGRIVDALGGGDPSGDAAVHRDLVLTVPNMAGPDVQALQRAINARARELPYTDANLHPDGQFGPFTLHAARRVAFALGLSNDVISAIEAGTVAQLTQQLIRQPARLLPADLQRAIDRVPELERRYKARHTGAQAAVRWARLQARRHVHENPPASNWGHPVQDWITYTGYKGPVPWCGCFVAEAAVKHGGAKVEDRIRLGFDGFIVDDANAKKNGFEEAVSPHEAQPGDIATFTFHHIGLVVGPTKNGMIHTIDGNTSAANGLNPDGGEVAEHRRPVDLVAVVGRLRY